MSIFKSAARNLISRFDDFEDETPTRDDITREWQPSRELIASCQGGEIADAGPPKGLSSRTARAGSSPAPDTLELGGES